MSKTGDHVPVNPSKELVGSVVNGSPSQIGGICTNVAFEVISIVTLNEYSFVQLGVVTVSAYTNNVEETEIESPGLSCVPPPLDAVK